MLAAVTLLLVLTACGGAAPQRPAATIGSIRGADLRSFTYHGGCGYEPVRGDVRFRGGRQASAPPEYPPYPPSRARITGIDYVRLDGVPGEAAAVAMECEVGSDVLLPSRLEHGRLVATEKFHRDVDPRCCASGVRTAWVGVGGGTAQRLAPNATPLSSRATGTPAGVVTVGMAEGNGTRFDAGALIDPRHVAVAASIYESGCPTPTRVYTSRGDALKATAMVLDNPHGLLLLTLAGPHPDAPLDVPDGPPAADTPLLLWRSSDLAPEAAAATRADATDAPLHRTDLVEVRAPGLDRQRLLPLAHTLVATDAGGRAFAIADRRTASPEQTVLGIPLRYAAALRSAPPGDFSDC
jgi:hypothetical protein